MPRWKLAAACVVAFATGVFAMRWAYHNVQPVISPYFAKPQEHFVPAHERRAGLFALSKIRPSIVMLGDSITEEGNWHELTGCPTIVNRGIGGNTSADVLKRVDKVAAENPKAVFLMIGAVDAASDVPPSETVANVKRTVAALPNVKVYVQLPLPARKSGRDGKTNDNLTAIDRALAALPGVEIIDLDPLFRDANGCLRLDLSYNALHLAPAGYAVWRDAISQPIGAHC